MDFSIYLEPVNLYEISSNSKYEESLLGSIIDIHTDNHFPDCAGAKVALIGVKEERRHVNNAGCAQAPDHIRTQLYNLYKGNNNLKIVDLGNIKAGFEIDDTYFALSSTIRELVKLNIVPVILGGSQDLTYANYLAFENLDQVVNIVAIDSELNLGNALEKFNAKTYLGKIVLHQPNFLFNYTNVGYQSYLCDLSQVALMTKLYFDAFRLGTIQKNIEEVEPLVRNADILSFDISAIRHTDAPANGNVMPNGFYGEEACQITRYAGLSDKLSVIGFYEMNPEFDNREQTAKLVAQMIWYFIDGVANRKADIPSRNSEQYLKYKVLVQNNTHEIVFYKSKKTDRWWMEVPYPPNKKIKFEKMALVPCSFSDYQIAAKGDMPDRWWLTFQKFS